MPQNVASRNRPASIHANICCKMFVGSNRMGTAPLLSHFLVPLSDDWTVPSSCKITVDATVTGNVIVPNGVVLTILSGVTFDIDFETKNLTVEAGGGVLIESGGKIT